MATILKSNGNTFLLSWNGELASANRDGSEIAASRICAHRRRRSAVIFAERFHPPPASCSSTNATVVRIMSPQAHDPAPVRSIHGSENTEKSPASALSSVGHDTSFERLRMVIDRNALLIEQIANQIALFVICGALRRRERLPPADAAARHAAVGKKTMVAVYQILEQYGMVTSTQGVGTIFTDDAERAARCYLLSDQAIALIRKGHALDLREEEIAGVFLAALHREK